MGQVSFQTLCQKFPIVKKYTGFGIFFSFSFLRARGSPGDPRKYYFKACVVLAKKIAFEKKKKKKKKKGVVLFMLCIQYLTFCSSVKK